MVIIAILAGAVMGGLQKATQVAREQRTKATIAKIHHFLMLKLESYKTRRITVLYSSSGGASDSNADPNLPLSMLSLTASSSQYWPPTLSQSTLAAPTWVQQTAFPSTPPWQIAAYLRLYGIRDLMRMEMPDRVGDVMTPPITLALSDSSSASPNQAAGLHVPEPAFHQRLNQMFTNPTAFGHANTPQNPAATLLYLTVTNGSAEARSSSKRRR